MLLIPTWTICSMYANPLGLHHYNYLKAAKNLGRFNKLCVIINNDTQVSIKGSIPFYNENERIKLVQELKWVDKVVLSIDTDESVSKTIKSLSYLKPKYLANGGDVEYLNPKEREICEKLGIKILFGIGGKKTGSSSWYIEKAAKEWFKRKIIN